MGYSGGYGYQKNRKNALFAYPYAVCFVKKNCGSRNRFNANHFSFYARIHHVCYRGLNLNMKNKYSSIWKCTVCNVYLLSVYQMHISSRKLKNLVLDEFYNS